MSRSQRIRRPYQRPVLTLGPKLAEIVAVGGTPLPCWVARAAFAYHRALCWEREWARVGPLWSGPLTP